MNPWPQSLVIISEQVVFAGEDETDESQERTSEEISNLSGLSEGMLLVTANSHCNVDVGWLHKV